MKTRAAKILDRLRRYVLSPAAAFRTLRLLAQRRVVAASPLFDRAWYLRQNPDLEAEGGSPELHYLFCGAAAGLDPGPGFCGAEYLALNPEARASGLNPLVHYERFGRRRGLRISFLQPSVADGRADPSWRFPTPGEHQASIQAVAEVIRAKAARGAKIRALFFVADAAMFPARALFEAMLRDPRFDARVAAIPDLRGLDGCASAAMGRCRAALSESFPREAILEVASGADGLWPDVVTEFGADIVCPPSPYDLSDFRFNPRWCVGRPVLPVYVNYGYPCTVFALPVLAHENYTRFWKVFFESGPALEAYRGVSPVSGLNGVITGDMKMDALAALPQNPGPRRRVLVAPHHSVEGGANDILALSNFLRYSDFFASLPAKFPELDFVFRPHPFLFPVLERPNFWGPAKCAAWRERFLSHPNAEWSAGGDPVRDFAAADAMIQDCSSFLAEWMFTGRPCCYMLKSEADFSKFLPFGRECLARCTIAYDAAAIEAFLREVVVAGRDTLAAEREAFRREIAVNWPNAADAALREILASLGLGAEKT